MTRVLGKTFAYLSLRSAMLCADVDCDTVFDVSAGAACPRCGSTSVYPLALALTPADDRPEERNRLRLLRG